MAIANIILVGLLGCFAVAVYTVGNSGGYVEGTENAIQEFRELVDRYDELVANQDELINELTEENERLRNEHNRTA